MRTVVLAAEAANQYGFDWTRLLTPSLAPFVLAALGIVTWGILGGVRAMLAHRERMAMIERGMHPGKEEPNDEGDV